MPNHLDASQDEPIDYAEVLERIGGDKCFLGELLKIYFEEFNEKRPLLQAAIDQGDFTQIQELGHSLKGASANLSLTLLKKAAFSLEVAGREKKIAQAQNAFRALESEYQRLKDHLRNSPFNALTT
jgi:HPt (histidine-containing phosphotransfer) domain-containing protein